MTLADDLRDAVRQSGRSHHEIAKAAGISRPCLLRFMNGRGHLGFESVEKLAALLGMKFTQPKSVAAKPQVLSEVHPQENPQPIVSPGNLDRIMARIDRPTKHVKRRRRKK